MRQSKLPKPVGSCVAALLFVSTVFAFVPRADAQGCLPARFVPLSLGAEGISQLAGGEWQASLNYRYLYADHGYYGSKTVPGYNQFPGNQITINSIDLQATYAFTPRYSATLTMPFVQASLSDKFEHSSRHTTSAGGLGDIWLVGNAWLLDPGEYPDGNISLGCGIKAPTGDSAASDTFYRPGPETRAVAVTIQPGDGGWGVPLELLAYQKVYDRLYGYVSGFYLINPRNENGTLTTIRFYQGQYWKNSVPDQYQGRGGFSYTVWPEQQLSVSLGVRIDGIPPNDAIGSSGGFRLPGYSIDMEPGFSWTYGKNTFNIFIPVLVEANKQNSNLDDQYGARIPAAFANWQLITSYSRRF